MPRSKKSTNDEQVTDYRYNEKRKNIPPAGLASQGRVSEQPKTRYFYDPHLPPHLRFDQTGTDDRLPELLELARQRALTADEAKVLAEALRSHQPWLEWTGKREKEWFDVDPVALHIHERVSAQAIIKLAQREPIQRYLFADPELDYRQAIQFYKHDVDWTNRLILGDSLLVMHSLARREDLAGRVQMIYFDPPYGIKFGSNFQPRINDKEVKDKDNDLTREPEQIKAYRDTWQLGLHSYLAYLRDRFILARELLSDSGSIFVQISDENLHRVRLVMDEVFGANNFISQIQFKKTGYADTDSLASICDYLLWYAKSSSNVFINTVFTQRKLEEKDTAFFDRVETPTGEWRYLTEEEHENPDTVPPDCRIFARNPLVSPGYLEGLSQPINFEGDSFPCAHDSHWKTTPQGIERLIKARRLARKGNTLRMVRYFEDYSVTTPTNVWLDLGSGGFVGDKKIYAVQTDTRVIQRCIFLTTRPGDLVLDPTCGSGTTPYVAELWGRRWIAIDTSRVAIALARQRLLTEDYPYYRLIDPEKGPASGFLSKTVPHITLKSIAQNQALDPIFARWGPVLQEKLLVLNKELSKVDNVVRAKLKSKLIEKERREGKRAVTDEDRRRWLLPENVWQEWQIPFDIDPDWPQGLQSALISYRESWRGKMDEVNATIKASAPQETLVDQPRADDHVLRVSGPFTVEGVQPIEESLDINNPINGEEEELDTFNAVDEPVNAEAYLEKMIRLLRQDGVRYPDNKVMKFVRLGPLSSSLLHAEGEWCIEGSTGEEARRVTVEFGPQYGPITAKQVEESLREAYRRGYDDIVFAGFTVDGAAQAIIQEDPNPSVRAHLAHIRPDVNMGDLLKDTPGSQLFTVFGLPRVMLEKTNDGEYIVTMEGVDIYDPVDNTIQATRADKVAAWFLDSDYDGKTFCITQAFFPDSTAWDKIAEALKSEVDSDRFAAFSGTRSLPFEAGNSKRIAVKVIDPRGNEVMRVLTLS